MRDAIECIINEGFVDYRDCRMSPEFKNEVLSDFHAVMMHFGKDNIFDHVSYCLQELMDNACKANEKRVYFAGKKLNIHNRRDYEQGMQAFKAALLENRDKFGDALEQQDRWVRIVIRYDDGRLQVDIENNAQILEQELLRVRERIEKARMYDSVADIFEEITDTSESAGLGIVMLCMILRKLGISDRCFTINRCDELTRATLVIPLASLSDEESEIITDSLQQIMNHIPQFPKHLQELRQLIRSHSFSMEDVMKLVRKDPSLTAEVLRMSNSAYYRRKNKIEQVQLAVSILGVRGLEVIINAHGAHGALSKALPVEIMEPLWLHSQQVADVTSFLCKRYRYTPELTEHAYNSALLHDIGRIVLQCRFHNDYETLHQICREKDVSVFAVEDLIQGVNHSILGAKLAEKWELPDALVVILRTYRLPMSCCQSLQPVAKIVYLAHTLVNMMHNNLSDYQTDNLPAYLGISDSDTLSFLLRELINVTQTRAGA